MTHLQETLINVPTGLDASFFFFPDTSCQATLVSIPPGYMRKAALYHGSNGSAEVHVTHFKDALEAIVAGDLWPLPT